MNTPRPLLPLLASALLSLPLGCTTPSTRRPAPATPAAIPASAPRIAIDQAGAVGDGKTLNTAAIQRLVDRLAADGGGTVVVPTGVFVSGALFLKPGVNLHLDTDAVLRCSTDLSHFPSRLTRIEGRLQEFHPALINAEGCDGLRITGPGVIDGDGRKIWDEFWTRFNADKRTRNLDIPRARLAFVARSRHVVIDGPTFKDSQFWNLHLYHCRDVLVQNVRFQVPDDYKQAPSTDGIDVDSSQDVLIRDCHFSVTDDCIAMKGSKGPLALEDRDSPPVERVRITGCTFRRGHAALTLGSEATTVRDVVMENSRVTGAMHLLHVKLRPDTPQRYENIHVRDTVLDNDRGQMIYMNPWTQYFDLQGHPPPRSVVRDITISNLAGRYGSFGNLLGNPGRTDIDGILFRDLTLTLANPRPKIGDVKNLRFENVRINDQPVH